jgi:hypothetical protein
MLPKIARVRAAFRGDEARDAVTAAARAGRIAENLMGDSAAKLLAISVLGLALAVAMLALTRRRRAAAALNGALALVFLALELPSLAAYLWDPEAYLGRYGAAAIGDLRLVAWGAVLAATAFACSIAAWRSRAIFLWLGWIDNLPTVALLAFLAFWFRVF